MLNEAKHCWLANRGWVQTCLGSHSCGLCLYRDPDDLLCVFRVCPKFNDDFRDAAEFEARVAAKLTDEPPYAFGFCQLCKYNTHGCRNLRMKLTQCRLKHARLAVEEEMEKEK